MSSQYTLTGRNGEFKVGSSGWIYRCTQWAVNPTLATTSEWGDSDSCGYTNRAAGRRDATFTAEGKYDSNQEVWDTFTIGTRASAELWLDGTSGTSYWYFPYALCTDFNMTVDIDTEEVIGWTSSWGADGRFYYPGTHTSQTSRGACVDR